jgi:ZIP family zinc transporter
VDVLLLLGLGSGTALATGLGAVPVFLLGTRAELLRPALHGLAAGIMGVASVVGLLMPALARGSAAVSAVGMGIGVGLVLGARRGLRSRDVHVGRLRGSGVRRAVLVFGVLLVHSIPEGLAIGTAFASGEASLGLLVLIAITVQNIPEGTATAIPMEAAGFGRAQQFWAAVLTSSPQPVAAVVAYLLVNQIQSLLPFSFAFAAGAMLTVVVAECLPQALAGGRWLSGVAGVLAGTALMLAVSAALAV